MVQLNKLTVAESLLSSQWLTYLLPYLFFPWRTDPLRFQAGCRKRRLNLAWVYLCWFCVVVRFFWLVNACFCCARFSSKTLAWGNVSEMTCVVSSGTTQLISRCSWPILYIALYKFRIFYLICVAMRCCVCERRSAHLICRRMSPRSLSIFQWVFAFFPRKFCTSATTGFLI